MIVKYPIKLLGLLRGIPLSVSSLVTSVRQTLSKAGDANERLVIDLPGNISLACPNPTAELIVNGYQPETGLDQGDPPQGGSGVPPLSLRPSGRVGIGV